MSTAVDNRNAMHPEPQTALVKRGEPTKAFTNLEQCARAVIKEMRARGHVVHSVELIAWKNPRQELTSITVIDLPQFAGSQS